MLNGSVGSAVFIGGEDLTDEVRIISDRAEFTGTYSHIFKGICRGEEVSIKVLKLVSKNLTTTKRKFRRELAVWKHVNHPNISPFYGYTEGNAPFGPVGALISPWYDNGDAEMFLQEKGETLSTEERIDLWRGVVSGVCYLHEQDPKIVHGDLKPSNILIDKSGSPRICDFGLAYIYLEEGHTDLTTTSPHTGTERYLAPELLEDDAQPSTASDVWALGCIGLQFLYSMIPYQHRKSNRSGSIFRDIGQGVLPTPVPVHTNARLKPFWEVLVRCWSLLPEERIDVQNVLLLIRHINGQESSGLLQDTPESEYENTLATKTTTIQPSDGAVDLQLSSIGIPNVVPSYLKLDHISLSELVLNPDGSVRAGTLPALIERLTMHTGIDAKFNDTFMMNFKSFTTIDRVFDMLVERCHIPKPEDLNPERLSEWTEKKNIPIRLRSINTMCKLIDVVEEEDFHILERVRKFAYDIAASDSDMAWAAQNLLRILQRLGSDGIESKEIMYTNIHNSPPSILPRKLGKVKLLEIDSLELARQLTIMESELFFKVKEVEYIAYSKESIPTGVGNIESIVTMNKKMADWVADAVLSKGDPKRRAAVIKHFINVAEHCQHLGNYSSLAALVTGLNNPFIRRLKRTWERVDVSAMGALPILDGIIDTKHDFRGYNERISKLQPPCVPFLQAHLTILASIQNGTGYIPQDSGLIDFQKCQDITDVVAGIMKFRMQGYNLSRLPFIRNFIDERLEALDNMPDLFKLSIDREMMDHTEVLTLLREKGVV